jgi:uncharacterized LabA/DUF88 family protein
MHRFSLFVDYSNLFGTLKGLDIRVTDYEAFFWYVFGQGADIWQQKNSGPTPPLTRLHRVYWYAVGSMDMWDFESERTRGHLFRMFDRDAASRRLYIADAHQRNPKLQLPELTAEAFVTYRSERRSWYEGKIAALDSMRKFYRTIRQSTQFIDIKDHGVWKVNIHAKSVEEKGVDTSLAVDMVALLDTYDVAIVISGDADMIPSIEYAKSRGKTVGVTEFVRGARPDSQRGHSFAARLRQAADFTLQMYESELVRTHFARKGIN